MGNKHTKQEYAFHLNKLGELLWKLAIPNKDESVDNIISTLEFSLEEEDYNFVFNCKYFNPIHYVILSGLWLPHDIYVKLTAMLEKVLLKCKYNKTEEKTRIIVFQNSNNVSNVNLNYIKMEQVKISLMRRGTMDTTTKNINEIRKNSLTQFNDETKTQNITSYTMHGKELKPPPPIKPKEVKEEDKKDLDRPLTYYMLSEEEQKKFNNLTEKEINDCINNNKRRVSTKKLWFNYGIYNEDLWKENKMSNSLFELEIGGMSYLSIISLIQIKLAGKYSSIPDAQKNMVHVYQHMMQLSLKKKRRSSIKDKIKSIFD